jgi:hypothetical protein
VDIVAVDIVAVNTAAEEDTPEQRFADTGMRHPTADKAGAEREAADKVGTEGEAAGDTDLTQRDHQPDYTHSHHRSESQACSAAHTVDKPHPLDGVKPQHAYRDHTQYKNHYRQQPVTDRLDRGVLAVQIEQQLFHNQDRIFCLLHRAHR